MPVTSPWGLSLLIQPDLPQFCNGELRKVRRSLLSPDLVNSWMIQVYRSEEEEAW